MILSFECDFDLLMSTHMFDFDVLFCVFVFIVSDVCFYFRFRFLSLTLNFNATKAAMRHGIKMDPWNGKNPRFLDIVAPSKVGLKVSSSRVSGKVRLKQLGLQRVQQGWRKALTGSPRMSF